MKIVIFILLFSFQAFSFSDKELIEQLTKIHGSEWSETIKMYGMDKIRSKLKQFLQTPQAFSFWETLDESDRENIYRNGITEFGNFVMKNGNKLAVADFNFLTQLANTFNSDWTSRSALAWFESLKNTASPEALETLMDVYEQVDMSETATKFTLIRIMKEMLVNQTETSMEPSDYSTYGKNRVNPHLDAEYVNGTLKKVYKKKLASLINDFLKSSDQAIKQGELKSLLQTFISELGQGHNNVVQASLETENSANEAKEVSATSEINNTTSPDKKFNRMNRNLASESSETKTSNPLEKLISYLIILLLPFLIGYFVYRKKVD